MYEIPKQQVPVVLYLANGETIRGKVFVAEELVSPAGNPDIDEFLNRHAPRFIPFQSEAGAWRLVNRGQVMYIETTQDDEEVRARTTLGPRALVLYFAHEVILYGTVYPTREEAARVSDILNESDNFLTIYRQGQKIIVNRSQVIYANAN